MDKIEGKVVRCTPEGVATVEYAHPIHGVITKYVRVPLSKGEDIIVQTLKDAYPASDFIALESKAIKDGHKAVEGMTFSFEKQLYPDWHDQVVERAEGMAIG